MTVASSEKESPPTWAGEVSGERPRRNAVPKLHDSVFLAKVEFKCGVQSRRTVSFGFLSI